MIDSIVPCFLLGNMRLMLSTKWWRMDFEKRYCRLLMCKRSKGPKIDPWDIPHVIVLMLDEIPCRKTYCFQLSREELIQFTADPRIM